jgi:outer membrane protein OmpA-like peptidoglycan-associated protein
MRATTTFLLLAALLAGCTTTDPQTGERKATKATQGAALGALAGAVVGAIANDGRGAAVGAAVGAAAGAGIGYTMDQQEAELRKQLEDTGVEVSREGDTIRLNMPGNVTFDTDRAEIRPEFRPVLDDVAETLVKYPGTRIRIAGHTDSTGSDTYNQQLSERRAAEVERYLGYRGVARERLESTGYGERFPIADNGTDAGRAANRRVEMELVPVQ